jgi:hypothetical protein
MVSTAPVVIAGGNYCNVSDATTRNLPLSGLVKADGTSYSIVNGDFLLMWVFYGGASTTNSVSGLTGLTKLADNVNVTTSTLYYKQNCQAADASATIAIATSASNRTCAIVAILKNVPTTGSWNLGYGVNGQASVASGATPTVMPSDIGGIRLEFAMWVGNTAPTDTPHADVAGGLTELRTENTGTLVNHVGSMANFGASGTAAGNVGFAPTAIPAVALVGGTTWTPFVQTPNGSKNCWTIVMAPTVVADTGKPTSIISSTGYTNVGGAASILAALADELDSTYAETSDDPVSLTLEAKFPLIAVQNRVGVRSRLVSVLSGSITYVISIYCNATLISTKTVVIAAGAGVVADELLSSPAETATVADWADLRVRYVLTKV